MSTVEIVSADISPADVEALDRKPPGVARVAFRMWRTRIGLLIVLVLGIIALFGRYIAPYGEREAVGLPFKPAGETRKETFLGSAATAPCAPWSARTWTRRSSSAGCATRPETTR